jgi:hypothetical protein
MAGFYPGFCYVALLVNLYAEKFIVLDLVRDACLRILWNHSLDKQLVGLSG